MTMVELTDEDFTAAAEVPISTPPPQPTIQRQHRCPRMREHLAGLVDDNRVDPWTCACGRLNGDAEDHAEGIRSADICPPCGTLRPGETSGDLPVPCPDCYSITVITVRGPYQPSTTERPLTEVPS